eukprot:2703541-Prymnesium_polylepis.1
MVQRPTRVGGLVQVDGLRSSARLGVLLQAKLRPTGHDHARTTVDNRADRGRRGLGTGFWDKRVPVSGCSPQRDLNASKLSDAASQPGLTPDR